MHFNNRFYILQFCSWAWNISVALHWICWIILQRNTPDARGKWSEDGLSQEFKEAMRAHAIYKYPECLFKGKHQGRKVNCILRCLSTSKPCLSCRIICNFIDIKKILLWLAHKLHTTCLPRGDRSCFCHPTRSYEYTWLWLLPGCFLFLRWFSQSFRLNKALSPIAFCNVLILRFLARAFTFVGVFVLCLSPNTNTFEDSITF